MRISDWSSDVCSSDLTDKAIDRLIGAIAYIIVIAREQGNAEVGRLHRRASMRQIRRRQASVWNAGCGGACWMAGANDSLRQLRRSSASSLSAPGIIITGHRSWPAGSPAKYETSGPEIGRESCRERVCQSV